MEPFKSMESFKKYLASIGKTFDDISFLKTDRALITRLGVNNQIHGTLLFIPENIIDTFDVTKPYEIYADENGNISEFVYNISEDGKIVVSGPQGFSIFFQFMGKLNNPPRKAEVTDLSGSSRKN